MAAWEVLLLLIITEVSKVQVVLEVAVELAVLVLMLLKQIKTET